MSRCFLLVSGSLAFVACGDPIEPSGLNHPPTASIDVPAIVPEGSRTLFGTDGTADPDQDALTFAWNFGDGATLLTTDRTTGHVYRNNGSYVATLIVTDSHGAADTASAPIVVANVAPQLTVFSVPDTVVARTPALVEIRYSDPGLDDTVRATLWLQRPGSAEGGRLTGPGFVELVISDPGAYGIGVILEDNDGATTYREKHFTVVSATSPSGQMR